MALINETIAPYSRVPQRTKPATFSEDADIFLTEQVARFESLNIFGAEANALRNEVNEFRDTTLGYKNDTDNIRLVVIGYRDSTLAYRNDALTYRNDAVSAKEAIDGYVIPTEATYSPETIDAKIDRKDLENFLGFNF